ncbi:hypothetical protein C8J56DRAFT_911870 [Mycena floridula]|nr:hypothetical protein C8J56DRAFT_911870 [Mycena floridula]
MDPQQLDQQASQLILNALERTNSSQPKAPEMVRATGSFSKMSFSSMMGGLSSLSLSRTSTNTSTTSNAEEKDTRGRSMSKRKDTRSSSQAPASDDNSSRSQSRARSQSPFSFRRRRRDPSPTPQPIPLGNSDVDLPDTSQIRPRNAFMDNDDSGDETVGEMDAETDDEEWSDYDVFDPVTERNTERNVFIEPPVTSPGGFAAGDDVDIDPDPLGEGVNVVVPPEPYFPSTLNSYSSSGAGSSSRGARNPRRRKSTRIHEPLPLQTSRPIFQRDRSTIHVTQGDPESKLNGRKKKRYVVASDMSEESRYAVEWGIGTVLRDGDEMILVTVMENESKVDPAIPSAADRATKLRSQQERQGLAYILVRQVTSLLQRTKLHVSVSCQAWHAKNSRHMLLDIVDYNEPVMLIVGSRGLGQLKGILLGSTSHYLIQKCSVPVMVARRRLKRPARRSAHLAKHRAHVSLAEAGIESVAAKIDQDVKAMRDKLEKEDEINEVPDLAEEDELEEADDAVGVKVAG